MTAIEFLFLNIFPFENKTNEQISHIITILEQAKEMEYKQNMEYLQKGMQLQEKENNRVGFRERNGLLSSQTEISDEEIKEAAKQTYREHPNNPKEFTDWTYGTDINFARKQKAFINGAKWYREQLKKK